MYGGNRTGLSTVEDSPHDNTSIDTNGNVLIDFYDLSQQRAIRMSFFLISGISKLLFDFLPFILKER